MNDVIVLAQAAVAAVAPAPQGVISYPQAFFAAQQPANAADMVQRLPGFTLDTGSSVRGFEGAAGNVLIDGQRPASKTDDLENILRRIPASHVERIDVIRGGAPGIDMQGKTVIANIIRKSGAGFHGLAAASRNYIQDGRSAGAARLEASGDWGPRKWELGSFIGRGFDDGAGDGTGVRVDRSGVRTPVAIRSEADGVNGQVTGVFETPALGGGLRINGRLFRDKFKSEETDVLIGRAAQPEASTDLIHTKEQELGVNFTRPLAERTTLELVGLRQTRDREIDSLFRDTVSSRFQLNRDTTETIGRVVLKHTLSDRLSLEGGGEMALNRLDSRTGLLVDGTAIPLPAANVHVGEDRTEVFAKAAWRPLDAWTVDASLRYERSEISSSGDVRLSKTLQYLKPRVAVAWTPREGTQLRLRAEREVGQLNFNDFVASANLKSSSGVVVGNPDLDPNQAWVLEAAAEQRFWGSGTLVVTYRHFDIKDVIDRGPVFTADGDVFDRPANIGDGTKDELALEWNVPLDRLGLKDAVLRGDLTRRWSEVADPTTRRARENSGLRPLDWNVYFTQDIPAWKMSWGAEVYGGWRETYYRFNLVETTKLGTFVKPFVEWRPRADLNLRVELPNVTARGLHREVLSYAGPRSQGGRPEVDYRDYQAGRMFYFRIRKTFGA